MKEFGVGVRDQVGAIGGAPFVMALETAYRHRRPVVYEEMLPKAKPSISYPFRILAFHVTTVQADRRVDTAACRRLSRTLVSSALRPSACIAWVSRVQCGLARRSFSASGAESASIAFAVSRKNQRSTTHRRTLRRRYLTGGYR